MSILGFAENNHEEAVGYGMYGSDDIFRKHYLLIPHMPTK